MESGGYVPMALTDKWGMVFNGNKNPYLEYSLELIRDKKFPVQAGQNMQCTLFDDVCVDNETGIIISVMHSDVAGKIAEYIGDRCKKEQLFMLCECVGVS